MPPGNWDETRKNSKVGTLSPESYRRPGPGHALTCPVPLLLSWYTLKRGKQMLCVMPAPATAVAP